ncbi:hypothetical protein NH340_JMT02015 [Sarcoptes scabiei]|nr:hypothetical protein NH340_JMT02015 [Sarcoptes scabiei]
MTLIETSQNDFVKSNFLIKLSEILSIFDWLLNCYNLDYFVENLEDRIPMGLRNCLEKIDLPDIPWIFKEKFIASKPNSVFPLTFLCLREISYMIRSFRSRINNELLPEFDGKSFNENSIPKLKHRFRQKLTTSLDHVLARGIKLKKRHEIERLCRLVLISMQKYRNELEIIDFGSGKCHLSRILSLCYGYKAHCIEADDNNINGAIVQDYKTMKALMKFRPKDLSDGEMPRKVKCFLESTDRIEKIFDVKTPKSYLFLGLHACGSLSNWILEEFARNSNSNCLILACCCYMRKELGPFPMSDCLKRKKDNKFLLTLEARELACHAVEKFLDKIIGNDLDSLRIHGYRAALELLIEKYAPQKRHVPMRTVTNISKIDFIDYVRRAIERMDDIILPNEAFQSDSIQKILNTKINRVAIFYSLRLLIAPIVEFFILMDYERFLCEQSSIRTAQIMPVFDPLISPRNLLLIAYK